MSNIESGHPSEIALDIYFERLVFQCLASAEFVRDISHEPKLKQKRTGLTNEELRAIQLEYFYLLSFFAALSLSKATGDPIEQMTTIIREQCADSIVSIVFSSDTDDEKSYNLRLVKQVLMDKADMYSQYQEWFSAEDSEDTATLFGDFGRTIARLAGRENNTVYYIAGIEAAMHGVKDLEAIKFIKSLG